MDSACDLREKIIDRLAASYLADPVKVATALDAQIDRSGNLLGWLRDYVYSTREPVPIPMLLFCPACGHQHIDAPEPATGWTNPSHRSHTCSACKIIWRPADVPTTGVAKIGTCGKADTWALEHHAKSNG